MAVPFCVMSWNVENLFPPGVEVTPGRPVEQAAYDAKLDYLVGVIRSVVPDVVALQEIGGRDEDDTQSLDDLQTRLGDTYPYKAAAVPDARGIRVAFLSKLALQDQEQLMDLAPAGASPVPNWPGMPAVENMGRAALVSTVEPVPGVKILLTTVHLKSQLITFPSTGAHPRFDTSDENERTTGKALALYRRAAEAATVRSFLNDAMTLDGDARYIVLGDLNDEPRAATSRLLLGPEDADATRDDSRDWVRLYNITDSIPGRGGAENDKVFLPEAERYSRIYLGRRELLDQILVSKSLLGPGTDLRQDRWRVSEVRSLVQSIESIGTSPAERVGADRPDHAPVFARFLV